MRFELQRAISLFTLTAFLSAQVVDPRLAQAAPASLPPLEIQIPSRFDLEIPAPLGHVEQLQAGDGPAILHLLTAHGNFEAQKNIESLLHHLYDQYGVKLLLLEGSAFKLQPEMLRFFPRHSKETMAANEELTKQALVKGAELFLVKEKNAEAYGIEDLDAYKANAEAFSAVMRERKASDKILQDLRRQLDEQRVSPELRKFLKLQESFDSGQYAMAQWFTELRTRTEQELRIDLSHASAQVEWPMLVRFFKLQKLEKEIDLKAFEKERSAFLGVLKKILVNQYRVLSTEPGVNQRLSQNSSRAQYSVPSTLYSSIKDLLEHPFSHQKLLDPETTLIFSELLKHLPWNFTFERYPQVLKAAAHLMLQSELKSDLLKEEMDRLSRLLAERLAQSKEDLQWIQKTTDYRTITKLLHLELTPQEFEMFVQKIRNPNIEIRNKSEYQNSNFLNKKNQRARVSNFGFSASDLSKVKNLVGQAIRFYEGAKLRDERMLKNVERILRETGENKAVLITGGFHAGPMQKAFLEKGFGYASITPSFGLQDKKLQRQERENYIRSITNEVHSPWSIDHRIKNPKKAAPSHLDAMGHGLSTMDLSESSIESVSAAAGVEDLTAVLGRSETRALFQKLLDAAERQIALAPKSLRSELREDLSKSLLMEALESEWPGLVYGADDLKRVGVSADTLSEPSLEGWQLKSETAEGARAEVRTLDDNSVPDDFTGNAASGMGKQPRHRRDGWRNRRDLDQAKRLKRPPTRFRESYDVEQHVPDDFARSEVRVLESQDLDAIFEQLLQIPGAQIIDGKIDPRFVKQLLLPGSPLNWDNFRGFVRTPEGVDYLVRKGGLQETVLSIRGNETVLEKNGRQILESPYAGAIFQILFSAKGEIAFVDISGVFTSQAARRELKKLPKFAKFLTPDERQADFRKYSKSRWKTAAQIQRRSQTPRPKHAGNVELQLGLGPTISLSTPAGNGVSLRAGTAPSRTRTSVIQSGQSFEPRAYPDGQVLDHPDAMPFTVRLQDTGRNSPRSEIRIDPSSQAGALLPAEVKIYPAPADRTLILSQIARDLQDAQARDPRSKVVFQWTSNNAETDRILNELRFQPSLETRSQAEAARNYRDRTIAPNIILGAQAEDFRLSGQHVSLSHLGPDGHQTFQFSLAYPLEHQEEGHDIYSATLRDFLKQKLPAERQASGRQAFLTAFEKGLITLQENSEPIELIYPLPDDAAKAVLIQALRKHDRSLKESMLKDVLLSHDGYVEHHQRIRAREEAKTHRLREIQKRMNKAALESNAREAEKKAGETQEIQFLETHRWKFLTRIQMAAVALGLFITGAGLIQTWANYQEQKAQIRMAHGDVVHYMHSMVRVRPEQAGNIDRNIRDDFNVRFKPSLNTFGPLVEKLGRKIKNRTPLSFVEKIKYVLAVDFYMEMDALFQYPLVMPELRAPALEFEQKLLDMEPRSVMLFVEEIYQGSKKLYETASPQRARLMALNLNLVNRLNPSGAAGSPILEREALQKHAAEVREYVEAHNGYVETLYANHPQILQTAVRYHLIFPVHLEKIMPDLEHQVRRIIALQSLEPELLLNAPVPSDKFRDLQHRYTEGLLSPRTKRLGHPKAAVHTQAGKRSELRTDTIKRASLPSLSASPSRLANRSRYVWSWMAMGLLAAAFFLASAFQSRAQTIIVSSDPNLSATNVSRLSGLVNLFSTSTAGATVSNQQISDRRYNISYNVAGADSYAAAGSSFDNVLTSTKETIDLRSTNSITVGLRDAGAPSYVYMYLLDTSNHLNGVWLTGVNASEKFFRIPVAYFNDLTLNLAQIRNIGFVLYHAEVTTYTSALEVRLGTHLFYQPLTPSSFDASKHTVWTNTPPVRIGKETGLGLVTRLTRVSDTQFQFNATLPGYTDTAAIWSDRGTFRPVTLRSASTMVTNPFPPYPISRAAEMSFSARSGDYYDVLKAPNLTTPTWTNHRTNVEGGFNYRYFFYPQSGDPAQQFFKVSTKLRAMQNMSSGLTIGVAGPAGTSLFVNLTDVNGITARFITPLSTTSNNVSMTFSNPDLLPLGFDASRIVKTEWAPNPNTYYNGQVTVWVKGLGDLGDPLFLLPLTRPEGESPAPDKAPQVFTPRSEVRAGLTLEQNLAKGVELLGLNPLNGNLFKELFRRGFTPEYFQSYVEGYDVQGAAVDEKTRQAVWEHIYGGLRQASIKPDVWGDAELAAIAAIIRPLFIFFWLHEKEQAEWVYHWIDKKLIQDAFLKLSAHGMRDQQIAETLLKILQQNKGKIQGAGPLKGLVKSREIVMDHIEKIIHPPVDPRKRLLEFVAGSVQRIPARSEVRAQSIIDATLAARLKTGDPAKIATAIRLLNHHLPKIAEKIMLKTHSLRIAKDLQSQETARKLDEFVQFVTELSEYFKLLAPLAKNSPKNQSHLAAASPAAAALPVTAQAAAYSPGEDPWEVLRKVEKLFQDALTQLYLMIETADRNSDAETFSYIFTKVIGALSVNIGEGLVPLLQMEADPDQNALASDIAHMMREIRSSFETLDKLLVNPKAKLASKLEALPGELAVAQENIHEYVLTPLKEFTAATQEKHKDTIMHDVELISGRRRPYLSVFGQNVIVLALVEKFNREPPEPLDPHKVGEKLQGWIAGGFLKNVKIEVQDRALTVQGTEPGGKSGTIYFPPKDAKPEETETFLDTAARDLAHVLNFYSVPLLEVLSSHLNPLPLSAEDADAEGESFVGFYRDAKGRLIYRIGKAFVAFGPEGIEIQPEAGGKIQDKPVPALILAKPEKAEQPLIVVYDTAERYQLPFGADQKFVKFISLESFKSNSAGYRVLASVLANNKTNHSASVTALAPNLFPASEEKHIDVPISVDLMRVEAFLDSIFSQSPLDQAQILRVEISGTLYDSESTPKPDGLKIPYGPQGFQRGVSYKGEGYDWMVPQDANAKVFFRSEVRNWETVGAGISSAILSAAWIFLAARAVRQAWIRHQVRAHIVSNLRHIVHLQDRDLDMSEDNYHRQIADILVRGEVTYLEVDDILTSPYDEDRPIAEILSRLQNIRDFLKSFVHKYRTYEFVENIDWEALKKAWIEELQYTVADIQGEIRVDFRPAEKGQPQLIRIVSDTQKEQQTARPAAIQQARSELRANLAVRPLFRTLQAPLLEPPLPSAAWRDMENVTNLLRISFNQPSPASRKPASAARTDTWREIRGLSEPLQRSELRSSFERVAALASVMFLAFILISPLLTQSYKKRTLTHLQAEVVKWVTSFEFAAMPILVVIVWDWLIRGVRAGEPLVYGVLGIGIFLSLFWLSPYITPRLDTQRPAPEEAQTNPPEDSEHSRSEVRQVNQVPFVSRPWPFGTVTQTQLSNPTLVKRMRLGITAWSLQTQAQVLGVSKSEKTLTASTRVLQPPVPLNVNQIAQDAVQALRGIHATRETIGRVFIPSEAFTKLSGVLDDLLTAFQQVQNDLGMQNTPLLVTAFAPHEENPLVQLLRKKPALASGIQVVSEESELVQLFGEEGVLPVRFTMPDHNGFYSQLIVSGLEERLDLFVPFALRALIVASLIRSEIRGMKAATLSEALLQQIGLDGFHLDAKSNTLFLTSFKRLTASLRSESRFSTSA